MYLHVLIRKKKLTEGKWYQQEKKPLTYKDNDIEALVVKRLESDEQVIADDEHLAADCIPARRHHVDFLRVHTWHPPQELLESERGKQIDMRVIEFFF